MLSSQNVLLQIKPVCRFIFKFYILVFCTIPTGRSCWAVCEALRHFKNHFQFLPISKLLISESETLGFAAQLCSTVIPSLKDNKGPEVDTVVITIMVLATIAVSLRLIARWISPKNYGTDDFLIIFALVRDGH